MIAIVVEKFYIVFFDCICTQTLKTTESLWGHGKYNMFNKFLIEFKSQCKHSKKSRMKIFQVNM